MFIKQFPDDICIDAYKKAGCSQIKAAQLIGCSRETIARAVRRAGIPLSGRENNRFLNNSSETNAKEQEQYGKRKT